MMTCKYVGFKKLMCQHYKKINKELKPLILFNSHVQCTRKFDKNILYTVHIY